MYQIHLAEVTRLSIDTIQPVTDEYVEDWSTCKSGIIVVKDDSPPAKVKYEPTDEYAAFDWDARYRTGYI